MNWDDLKPGPVEFATLEHVDQMTNSLACFYNAEASTERDWNKILEHVFFILYTLEFPPPLDYMKTVDQQHLVRTLLVILGEETALSKPHPADNLRWKIVETSLRIVLRLFEFHYPFESTALGPEPFTVSQPREAHAVKLFGDKETTRLRNIAIRVIESSKRSVSGDALVKASHLLRVTSYRYQLKEQVHDKLVDLICDDDLRTTPDMGGFHLFNLLPYSIAQPTTNDGDQSTTLLLKYQYDSLTATYGDGLRVSHAWLLAYGSKESFAKYSRKIVLRVIKESKAPPRGPAAKRLGPLLGILSHYAYAGALVGISMNDLGLTDMFLSNCICKLLKHKQGFVQAKALNVLSDYLLTSWCSKSSLVQYDFGPLVDYELHVVHIKYAGREIEENKSKPLAQEVMIAMNEELRSGESGEIKLAAIVAAMHCLVDDPTLCCLDDSGEPKIAMGCLELLDEFPRLWRFPISLLETMVANLQLGPADLSLGEFTTRFATMTARIALQSPDEELIRRAHRVMQTFYQKSLKTNSMIQRAKKQLELLDKVIKKKLPNIQL